MAIRLLLSKKRSSLDPAEHRRRFREKSQALNRFCTENPALFYSLFFLIGVAIQLTGQLYLALLLLPLILTIKFRSIIGLLLTLLAFFYAPHDQHFKPYQKISGIFYPQKISQKSYFARGWAYSGFLYTELGKIQTKIHFKHKRPKAGKIYVTGQIKKVRPYLYSMKALQFSDLTSKGFANFRFRLQKKVMRFIDRHFTKNVSALFTAVLVGEIQDRFLQFKFQQLGLSHLLAISGFHFALITMILLTITRFFLPRALTLCSLIVLSTLYFFFLGFSPSIFRAYLVLIFYLFGELTGRKTSAFNLLGSAMLFEMIFYPPVILNLGFQLSFISCFGLLFFHHPIEKIISCFFKARTKEDIKALNHLSQIGHLFSSITRKALSITLSVSLVLIPVLLFYFKSFPLISFLYNLFIPPLLALSVVLFFLFLPFPYLLKGLSKFVEMILNFIFYPPLISTELSFTISPTFIIFFLSVLFLSGIYFQLESEKA